MRNLPQPPWMVYIDNPLVIRWYNPQTKVHFSQGKRVRKNFPLTREERRVYVKGGYLELIKHLRIKREMPLFDAIDLVNLAVGR